MKQHAFNPAAFFADERCPFIFPLTIQHILRKTFGIALRQGHDGTTVYFLVAKEPLLRCGSTFMFELRDGGLVHVLNENQGGKQKHSKQLKKYSGKGNQEKRHTLHGFGCGRRLAEGEMPCGALGV